MSSNNNLPESESCSSSDAVCEAQAAVDEAQANADYYLEKAAECESYAEALEAALQVLEDAMNHLYEVMREAEQELERAIEEAISAGDHATAAKLQEQLNELRGYISMMQDIRESFNSGQSLSWGDIVTFSAKMATVSKGVRDVSPALGKAAERLIDTARDVTTTAIISEFQLLGMQEEISAIFGDPINVLTGNFYYTKKDLTISGKYPLEFKRFYNALGNLDGVLGLNWTHNYNIRLFDNGEQVHIMFDDGHVETYTRLDDGFYVAPIEQTKVLMPSDDGGFTLTLQTMQQYHFDAIGALCCISDTNGNKTILEYEGDGILLSKVTTASGSLSFDYNDNGRISNVSDHIGRKVSFEYEQDYLTKVIQPHGAEFKYEYDASNLISKVTDVQGIESIQNVYDEKGRTIVQHMADGGVMYLAYDDERMITTTTDQAGNKVDHYRDEKYRTVKIEYGDCNEHFEYDEFNNRTKYVDRCKNVYRYEHDVYGNMTKVIDPLGNTTSTEYNNFNKPVKIAQSNEGIISFTYDDYGNMLRVVDPIGRETSIAYDNAGIAKTLTLPDASQNIVEHDERGNIIAITDGLGIRTQYEYDGLNRVAKSINAEGATTTFEYNIRGDISKVTDALGNTRSYEYNLAGQVTRMTDFDRGTLDYTYNSIGKLEQITDKAGGIIKMGYDLLWNVTSITDPSGETVSYEYNRYNRLIRSIDTEGNSTEYRHDHNGNVIATISPLGAETKIKYDALNRQSEIIEPDGAITKLTYDKVGNITEVTDALGNIVKREYDIAGQLIKRIDPLGNVTTFTYTVLGKIENIINAQGERQTFTYYPGGRIKSVSLPNGESTNYEYDNNGNIIRITDALGNVTTRVYDSLGRVIQVINPLGHSRKFAYDALENITETADENGNVTQYKYSPLGDIVEVIDAAGNSAKYTYDAMSRLTGLMLMGDEVQITTYELNKKGEVIAVTSPLGDIVKYNYNQDGNVTSKLDQDGLTTLYDYNLVGKLSKISYADGKTVEFSYNALKQLTEMRDWLGTTKIEPDALGRATKITDFDGNEVNYAWNSIGKKEKLTYPDGSEVNYTYNAAGQLMQVKAGADITSYAYDNVGRIAERLLPDGTTTNYEFNARGAFASLTHAKNGNILDQFKYTYDPVGNITQIEKHRVGVEADNGIFRYAYDPLSRLVEAAHGHSTKTYGYDSIGNRITSVHNGIQTDHIFNARNQLIKTTAGDDITEYTYDLRGNLTNMTENGILTAAYTFDATNMMTGTTTGNGIAEYAYNGFRKRVAKLESLNPTIAAVGGGVPDAPHVPDPTAEVRYILDLTRPYDDLLAIQGTQNQSFVWGDSLLSANGTDGGFHYLQDHLGSSIRLVGAENTAPMAYDEFGVPEVTTSNASSLQGFNNPFGFTGYQTDKISNLYYAQARYYNPTAGRFFAKDPIKDKLNWYGYCNSNPVNFLDPAGLAASPYNNLHDRYNAAQPPTIVWAFQNDVREIDGIMHVNNVAQVDGDGNPIPFVAQNPSGICGSANVSGLGVGVSLPVADMNAMFVVDQHGNLGLLFEASKSTGKASANANVNAFNSWYYDSIFCLGFAVNSIEYAQKLKDAINTGNFDGLDKLFSEMKAKFKLGGNVGAVGGSTSASFNADGQLTRQGFSLRLGLEKPGASLSYFGVAIVVPIYNKHEFHGRLRESLERLHYELPSGA